LQIIDDKTPAFCLKTEIELALFLIPLLYQRERFSKATPADRHTLNSLDKTLIELGCDPDRTNSVGLSYNDLTMTN
jgi:hypothetical protein